MQDLEQSSYVTYPPGGDFLLLPRAPARAARAGLALHEAVERRQIVAIRVTELLIRARLYRLQPRATQTRIDWKWWARLLMEVVEPLVGPVAHVAFRVPGSPRVAALLTGGRGCPLGFVKITDGPRSSLAATVDQRFAAAPPRTFLAPRTLLDGQFDDVSFRLMEPLPEGPHRPPPLHAGRVRAVVDEFHDISLTGDRPRGIPLHHVPCHADFTPRNLRILADGQWALFDWDSVRWGPRLADELRYWSAALVYRGSSGVERNTARILTLLRQRGDDDDIREAAGWAGALPKTYREAERTLHAAVGAAVSR